jgi:hypothetical protein
VLLRQPAGSCTRRQILEGLWFTDSFEGVAQDGFDEMEGTQSDFALSGNPIIHIVDELMLENSLAGLIRQV